MLGAVLAKRAVARGFAAIDRRDLDTILGMSHEDSIFEFPGRTVMGGRFQGREEIGAWYQRWFDRMPQIHFTLRHVSVDRIFALGATNAVHVEWDLDETDREGHAYHLTGVTAMEVEGGKVRRSKEYVFEQDLLASIWPPKPGGTD
jgi:ketosteroid isomerase-like protein